ncbi:phytase [Cylindrospermopsis raciborskii]|uniref:phytase n=1 Tax=Cylindrospermopsis raciborskii TaxID=77022 RepID=UPI001F40B8D5|nr:phytase [Cylindrospermopsis raciborskii]UJS04360.1 phytase [Cylindrospermopsis raciborskii KLL07]
MATITTVRFSQFNASLNRNTSNQLVTDLSTTTNAQAKSVAEIIQRANPDVLLINEFDYIQTNPTQAIQLLQQNYLGVSQNGATPIIYPYSYIAPSNTGIASGFDLNNNGAVVTTPGAAGYGDDSFGFGNFPGQFGMLLLSKYEIDTANVRTFQNFLWKDMPGNLLTNDPTVDNPATTTVNENLGSFYSPEEIAVLRLSSKSHWDVPIKIGNQTIHVLVSHPTPPVFDGTEDRNGKRNYDEIRFWSDYITPGKGDYIYDDTGKKGSLASGSSFVIMGDENADPQDGDSYNQAILQLLQNPNINTNFIPTSLGAVQQSTLQGGANVNHRSNPAFDTSDFADTTPGNLRSDYVLPSTDLKIANSAVFWPVNTDPNFALVGTFNSSLPGGFPSSDHRLVLADIQVDPTPGGKTVPNLKFVGQKTFVTGFIPPGTPGKVNGTDTPMGGLSGVVYDVAKGLFYAISDDRSQFGPARFYTFTLNPATSDITFTNVTPITDTSGNLFPALSLDPEGIALTSNGTVFISSEGEANPSAGRVTNPFIKEFDLTTGKEIRTLLVPSKFLPVVQDTNGDGVVNTGDTQTSGVRNNLAFESLTISPDQKTLYTATENALLQDGDRTSLTAPSRSRVIQYNLVTGQPEKEYLYLADAIAKAPTGGTAADSGLVDLLAIDNRGTLLALERSFAVGQGNTIKIYEVTLQGATDITTINSLSGITSDQLAAIQPVQKRLVLNLDTLNLPNSDGNHPTGTDNIEGLSFGPRLADGRQSIVLVSDNNFGATQFTQILTLGGELLPTVIPTVETRPDLFDDPTLPTSQRADADDPAIYVNSQDPSKSIILTAVKNAGLRVYDLTGKLLQEINPGSIRYNNIDLQYGFTLGGEKIDIAVASDRQNDKLVIFKINPQGTGGNYLENITDSSVTTLFQGLPFVAPYSSSSRSAYGITIYRSLATKDYYVFASRRQTGDVAQFKLIDKGNGKVGYERVREFTIPAPSDSTRSAQTEGMVADQEMGFVYIGQEDVGIWKFDAEPNGSNVGKLVDKVKFEGGQNLTDDAEGLTIYYGKNGTGYLLASSQGDNSFAVYTREGSNDFLGRFAVGSNGAIDSVQESDGADVINLPLGANFPMGLFVTQDGNNEPAKITDGENINSNFKLVPWENIANGFPTSLKIDTTTFNPRTPIAQSLVNGVASGDTTQTSTILWTRSLFTGQVTFEYGTTPDFSTIVGKKTVNVTNTTQPVKVLVDGLTPGTNYYYRVSDVSGGTATGKFSTAATSTTRAGLKFGVSGDWRGELAPYPAINNADTANLKFFVQLGDTIYADVPSPGLKDSKGVEIPQATTLEDYRAKHSEVYGLRYGQNTWGDLRASTSILTTIDDHEVYNDFAGMSPSGTGLTNDNPFYENGLQAFQEYNPISDQFYSQTGDSRIDGERKLYRYNTYGSDAATFVLDARSFRDTELPPVTNPGDLTQVGNFLAQSFNPNRTLLGRPQVEDLKKDLLRASNSGITWKFIMLSGPIQNLGVAAASDRYEGYAAERTELLKFIDDNKIKNVVFVTADFHGTIVNNLTYQTAPSQAQIPTNTWEIITGSVAYDAPFGPTVAGLFLTPQQKAFYDSLPTTSDGDSVVNDKDDFIKQAINNGLQPFGYDPIGLNNNLSQVDGLINSKLLQGDYIATHTYGWTEFNINPTTQKLTVTTYGIKPYTEAELVADPNAIINLQPQIVSQFEVEPNANNVPQASQLVFGTTDRDVVVIPSQTDGIKDLIFTGSGNDEVDTTLNTSLEGFPRGENTIHTGSGKDVIYAGNGDRIFGGSGDDEIYATDAKDYRLSGGSGNDVFHLGVNGRALGGDGDDKFFVSEGGGNLISGGAGADQFWIATGDIPKVDNKNLANTIVDFQIGTDVLGISGQVQSFGFKDLTLTNNDIIINGNTIATLIGVNTSTLTVSNFSFV